MGLAEITERIRDMILEVPDTGKAYDFQRTGKGKTEADFKDTFFDPDTQTIRFFEVWRRSSDEIYSGTNRQVQRTHTMVVDGFLGTKDATATQKTFQALIEEVVKKFRNNNDLKLNVGGPVAGVLQSSTPPQVVVVDLKEFSQKILHHAEITVEVRERINS